MKVFAPNSRLHRGGGLVLDRHGVVHLERMHVFYALCDVSFAEDLMWNQAKDVAHDVALTCITCLTKLVRGEGL